MTDFDRFTKGQQPLSQEKFELIRDSFDGKYAIRNRCIFMFGYYTGFRINEILQIKFGTLFEDAGCSRFRNVIFLQKELMKAKKKGRKMVLNDILKQAILAWVEQYREMFGEINMTNYLFCGRKKKGQARLNKESFALILHKACDKAGIPHLGTHCMRKSFANNMYRLTGKDIIKTQKAMGHANVETTLRYLEVDFNDIADVVKRM